MWAAGVLLTGGRPAQDAGDVWLATHELGGPVAVEPFEGNPGRRVTRHPAGRELVVSTDKGHPILIGRQRASGRVTFGRKGRQVVSDGGDDILAGELGDEGHAATLAAASASAVGISPRTVVRVPAVAGPSD